MATKVLSIEIGQGLTRVVEMDYKVKNPKVYNYFTFETPKDVIDDGMVKRSDAFTGLFKAECEKINASGSSKEINSSFFSVEIMKASLSPVRIPLLIRRFHCLSGTPTHSILSRILRSNDDRIVQLRHVVNDVVELIWSI